MRTIDENCHARCIAADSAYTYWIDKDSRALHQGRVEDGRLVSKAVIDDSCTARLLAANDAFIYWVDDGSTTLHRGRAENGRLVDVTSIDENCRARALGCDSTYLYWVDEGSKELHQGRVVDGRLVTKAVIDSNCTARCLTANDDYVYWIDADSTVLHRAIVEKNRLQAGTTVYRNVDAATLAANQEEMLWVERSAHRLNAIGASESGAWMAELAPVIGALPLNRVVFPGTHDSATASLDPDLDLAPDAPDALKTARKIFAVLEAFRDALTRDPLWSALYYLLVKILGDWSWHPTLRRLVLPASQAQGRTIAQQLAAGIRYFDLRVADRSGTLRVCHTLYGEPITHVIDEVAAYLDANDREIVIFDLQNFYDVSDGQHHALAERIVETIGRDRLVPAAVGPQVRLDTLWQSRQRVVVLHRDPSKVPEHLRNLVWSRDALTTKWANTMSVDTLLETIDHWLDNRPTSFSFSILQGQLTYDVFPHLPEPPSPVIPTNPLKWPEFASDWRKFLVRFAEAMNDWDRAQIGLRELASRANPEVLTHLAGAWREYDHNVLILDHFEIGDLVETAKTLNREKAPRRKH